MTSSDLVPGRPGRRPASSSLVYRDEDEDAHSADLVRGRTAGRLTEAQWQRRVIDLAGWCGWLAYHPFDSRRSTAGWPDLALVRDGRLVLAELKSEAGRVSPEQRTWLAELSSVAGVETYLWRPSDWPKVQKTLAMDPPRMAVQSIPGPPTPPLPSDPYVLRPGSPHSGLTESDQPGGAA